ncbi:DUF4349 domain-containing protein [Maribacter sp. 2-571]|uniref:DUF4349 domain-containing protein n=1 Tax=Maribacter sp. 2-571 TaxID=3417569 RepID=UPI003D32A66F
MKSNVFSSILFSSVFILAIGCSQKSNEEVNMIEMGNVPETEESNGITADPDADVVTEKNILADLKIIKNAQCRFKVSSVDSTTASAQKIATSYSGYISDMRFTNDSYRRENRFTVRVPQKHFEEVLERLTALAEFVEIKDISSKDVSEEYVDLQSRLKTKLEVKQRYDDILRTKAKTVEDILLAEEKLRVLQEEIEAAQGRLQFLSSKVALSTIQVDLYETVAFQEAPESYTKSFGAKALEGVGGGWQLVQYILLALLYIWPILFLGVGIVLYWKWRKKKRA